VLASSRLDDDAPPAPGIEPARRALSLMFSQHPRTSAMRQSASAMSPNLMTEPPENGMIADVDGQRCVFYDGYWIKYYEPPPDNLFTGRPESVCFD